MTQRAPVVQLRAKHLAAREAVALQERAEEAAERRFDLGEVEQNKLVEKVTSTVIRDKLVPPTSNKFELGLTPNGAPEVRIRYPKRKDEESDLVATIHHHALGQLANKVKLPMDYVNNLNTYDTVQEWRTKLLIHNLNELYQEPDWGGDRSGKPIRFLHRLVGTQLRGFLSRRFNLHLASMPMLGAFVESCKLATARPVEAVASDVRFSLKCYLPHVFEAYPGQFICVGAEWTNSDFGVGKHMVSQSIWDPLRNTGAVLDESISQVHLGSLLEDSDIEMSAETVAKEVDATASAIRDSVAAMLSDEAVKRLLEAIKLANEHEVTWNALKGQLSKFLYKKEIESIESILKGDDDIIDLPPAGRDLNGNPIPTKWWAASIVSTMAARTKDADRKIDLQHEAGKLLSGLLQKGEA
jgi:hypothetical protein